MPVTRTRNGFYDLNLDQTNTTRFLFGDDEPNHLPRGHTPDDSFPTLVRRDDQIVSHLLLFHSCNISRLEKERRSALLCSLCFFFFYTHQLLAAVTWRLAAGSASLLCYLPTRHGFTFATLLSLPFSSFPSFPSFPSYPPLLSSFPSVRFLSFSSSLASNFSASCTTFIQLNLDL